MLRVAAVGTSYPEPILHIDASYVASMFDASSGGSPTANNGTVARIEDRSGNGHHMVENLVGGTRSDATQNGLAALDMESGTKGYNTVTGLTLTRPYTIMLIAKQNSSGDNRILNAIGANSLMNISRASACVFINGNAVRNSAVAATNTVGILTMRVSASATTTLYFNGTTDIADGSPASADWGELTIGRPGLFNESPLADLFELLVWNTHLADVDWQAAQTEKAAKWGITI
jgi:hypothetical protein